MINTSFNIHSNRVRRAAARLIPAAALLLLCALAIPARAEDRAVKSRVAPVYPEIAKRMRIEGVIKLQVMVEADGRVSDVKTISGNRALSIAAEDAVRKWRFMPGDAATAVEVSINFALQ